MKTNKRKRLCPYKVTGLEREITKPAGERAEREGEGALRAAGLTPEKTGARWKENSQKSSCSLLTGSGSHVSS